MSKYSEADEQYAQGGIGGLLAYTKKVERELAALRSVAPEESEKRDAARYRWLRDVCAYEAWHAYVTTPPAAMDAAIDKGMSASRPQREGK